MATLLTWAWSEGVRYSVVSFPHAGTAASRGHLGDGSGQSRNGHLGAQRKAAHDATRLFDFP